MVRTPRVVVALSFLFMCWSIGKAAAQVPISVFPNPIQFGTVAENSTSFPLTVYVGNSSTSPVNVSGITISGTNSSEFAFDGATCAIIISGGQTCEMSLSFTPTAMGSASASLVVTFSGTGSPLTIPLGGAGGNPIPTITSISPGTAYVEGPGLTLTVKGTGFVPSSVVGWQLFNNATLATTYKSSTLLTAQVPAADLLGTGSATIYVTNPGPAGGSASASFQIVSLDPTIQSISPISVKAGTGATTVFVSGNNFMSGASVLWNGSARTTTYVNSNLLQAQLTATDLATPQIAQIYVSNPSPGGISTQLTFDVTFAATVRIIDLPANDLVWDPFAQLIYASLPSSYGPNGNSIGVINPATGAITGYFFAGSEPNRLALSADGKYLYVGLNGDGSIQRLVLPGFTPDINVSLGNSQNGGPFTALDLKVSPGNAHTFAVVSGINTCCGGGGTLEFFTDASKLANSVSNPSINNIVFADASTLYGFNGTTLSKITVTSTGGTVATQWNYLLAGNGPIQYSGGLLYSNGGEAFNPATGELAGVYDMQGGYGCCSASELVPESAINTTFVAGTSPFFSELGITSYNLSHFTPEAVINLDQLSGTAANLISWGSNGLAFTVESSCCSPPSQTVLVQSSMMMPVSKAANPLPLAQTVTPGKVIHGSWNYKMTVNGSGFVPGSSVTWNGKKRTVGYVNKTQLKVYVPWSDVVKAGTASVVVHNPTPGGGTSNGASVAIQ
jgi:trimeric autotransporter adhesin